MKPNSTQPGQKTCTWSRRRSWGRAQHMCTPTLLLHVVPRWHRDNRSKGRGWQCNLSPGLLLMALLDRLHSSARSMFVQCYFITLLCPLGQFRQTFIFSSHRKNCCWKRICAAKKTKDLQINETLTAVWLVLFYFVYAQDQWQQAHPDLQNIPSAGCSRQPPATGNCQEGLWCWRSKASVGASQGFLSQIPVHHLQTWKDAFTNRNKLTSTGTGNLHTPKLSVNLV